MITSATSRLPLVRSRRLAAGGLLALWLAAGAPHLRAQNVPSNRAATGGQTNAAGTNEVERVVVTGVNVEDNILPTNLPFTDAYGIDVPIKDLPRSANTVSRTQLIDADVQIARDLSRIDSSLYTPFINGSPSSPYIRGQAADVFVNGVRLGFTSEGVGIPLDFNAVETVDIVKGPAPALYGASQLVGGFIDLNTKRPFFDKLRGFVSTTNGEYGTHRWNVDLGGPIIKNQLAFRLSYTGEESDSYYRNDYLRSQAIYAALSWTPSERYRVEFLNEFFEESYQQNRGINRPTTALIDDGAYVTGTPTFVNTTGSPARPPVLAPLAPGVFPPQRYGVITPTGVVKIDRRDVIIGNNSGAYAKTDLAQVIQTLTLNDHVSLLNTSHFYYLDRREFSSLRYSAIVEPSYQLANRTELHLDFETPLGHAGPPAPAPKDRDQAAGKEAAKSVAEQEKPFTIRNQLNLGFDFRHQHVFSATDIAHSYNNAFDLTQDPANIFVPLSRVLTGTNASLPIPGRKGYYATPGGTYVDPVTGKTVNGGNGETNDTWSYDYAIFLQDRISFGDHWALFLGARGDLLHVDFVDPVHPPGFSAVSTSTTQGLVNLNASLTYQPVKWATSYFTYNYSQSTSDGQGGGYSIGGDNKFDNPDFRRVSELYEGGFKFSLLNDKLFISTAGFRQSRSFPQQDGPTLPLYVWGGEFEAAYQPNRNFFATVSYTYLDAWISNQSAGQNTRNALDAFTRPVGNGIGYGDRFTYPVSDYRLPDIPHHTASVRLNYQFDFGLGASFGALVTGPIPLTYNNKVKTPTQYQLDLGVFYVQKYYEVRLDVFNFTNQKNWSGISGSNGQDLVYPEQPLRVQGTVRFKF